MANACFATPSFSLDLARCRLLVESRELMAPDLDHFIIVDPNDVRDFASLRSSTTHVIDSRELFDREFFPIPFMKGWWQSYLTMPIRGWITQQMRKLALGRIADHELFINVDSDVVFLKPFDPSVFVDEDGRTALFSVDYRNSSVATWSTIAATMLGSAVAKRPNNHVGMIIPWRRNLLQEMLALVESIAGCPWQRVVARSRTFSEYQLYGHYVENVVGLAASRSFVFDKPIVKTTWDHPISDEKSLQRFFSDLSESHLAAMIHSKDCISPSDYIKYVHKVWDKFGAN